MRVLHYSKYYPPFFGGIEKVAYDLVLGQRVMGHAVDVLCFSHHGAAIREHSPEGEIVRSSVFANVASTPLSLTNLRDFSRMAENYDVIHVHLPNPVANLAVFLSRPTARVVLHWHTDIVRQKNILKLYDPLQQWLLRRADAVIATSPPYAESSPWLREHANKVEVIPLGVDVGALAASAAAVAQVKARYGGRRIIFSLGRLVYYKGFEYLVRAAERLPDDVVVVIGGVGELQEDLSELIRASGLGQKVILAGTIPFHELGAHFAACDIFCLPSVERSEAYGVVQVEAMSFAKPVVSTEIPGSGVSWVNQHEVSGLVVPPADAESLSKGLNSLLESSELRACLGAGARQRYERYFRVEHMTASVDALYRRISV